MTDDFSKYVAMKEAGATPQQVCATAREDAVDEITLLRLLRNVFVLTFPQAKQIATEGDVLSRSQDVTPGKPVYWEGWNSLEGFYVMRAMVEKIVDDRACLTQYKKFKVTEADLVEVPLNEPVLSEMRISYLRKPFGERLANLLAFAEDLAQCSSYKEAV